jgi:two-component system sensor histidine kinase AlgZ
MKQNDAVSTAEDFETFDLPELVESQALFLLMIAAQLLVMLLVVFRDGLNIDWQYMAGLTVYVQWQALCSALALSLVRPKLLLMRKNLAASLSFFVLLATGFIIALMAQWLMPREDLVHIDWGFIARSTVLSGIVAGVGLRYLFVQQSLIQREKAALMASLTALQAKIKPHFLFNTMNSIASLIGFAPEKAERMIEDLCALLRASLQEETVETTIAQEWQLCERYLQIEKLRLDERLQWQVDFSAVDTSWGIPSLSLQPIIENAIYHGIQPSPEPGFIELVAKESNGIVEIFVKNSQSKEHQANRSNKGNQMAIANTRNRIKQLYGQDSDLIMTDLEDSFEVCLRYRPNKGENK